MENLITAFPQYLEPPNLAEYLLKVGGPNPQSHVIFCSRGHVKNLKNSICILTTPMADVFKTSVATMLITLSLLSVMLHSLDDKIILILFYLTFRSSPQ